MLGLLLPALIPGQKQLWRLLAKVITKATAKDVREGVLKGLKRMSRDAKSVAAMDLENIAVQLRAGSDTAAAEAIAKLLERLKV
jgi:hypothetical protein